ncbi:helix-turn-helix transcriptional regulator [Agreia pratensis]|uniref:response regulator transcription factor n=1 Tax=Agreia pratensis TaxID=150121 RepID=UPI00188BD361|nr:helix-turn-helix transcriptional regulator [Agreia pratensis]MBF4632973.1 helix-turn-helix transcriptional regulator [Agreia pratensis]
MTPIGRSVGAEESERAARFRRLFASTLRTRGWREAQPLIEQHWHEFALTEPDVLLDVIKMLPSEVFIENPTWLIGVDHLRHAVAGEALRSTHLADPAALVSQSRGGGLKARLIAATGRIVSSRTAGRLPEAVAGATEAHRALRSAESDELAPLKATLPHLTIQWSRAMEIADHPGAVELYEDTYETALLFDQPDIARRAAASLAWMYAEQGHTHEARSWLDRGNGIDLPTSKYDTPLFLAAALLAVDALDRDEARAQLAMALRFPAGEYWAALLWVRSHLCSTPSDVTHVERDLSSELLHHPEALTNSGANLRYLDFARWVLNRPQSPVVRDPRAPLQRTTARDLIDSEVAYRQGSFDEALRRCAPLLTESTAPRFRASALLLTAASRFRLGRTKSGIEAFRQAHALAEHENLLLVFSMIDRTDLRELARLSGRELRPIVDVVHPHRTSSRPTHSLSRRERQVLSLLATELPNAEIAQRLFVTMNTLKSTLRNVYRKLGVHDRQSASDAAQMMGIDRSEH